MFTMFTQFFGNYLLEKRLISPEALTEAFEIQKNTRMKLGVLAINAGYMTAEQVEKAHDQQQRADKRIGDVMVEMGFLTQEQVEELLKTQPAGHLLLGQALVDKGHMTNAQFEEALKSYKEENQISDSDFDDVNDDAAQKLVEKFCNFNSSSNSEYMTKYVSILFKNLIRFIGGDFTPMEIHEINAPLNNVISQKLSGGLDAVTIIDTDTDISMVRFASRFSGEHLLVNDEYTKACVSEFLNLHNGLFTVNISNDANIEIQLEPQSYDETFDAADIEKACVIPIFFSFGMVNFIIHM